MENWKSSELVNEDARDGEADVAAARVMVVGGMVEVAVTMWVIAWARERGRRERRVRVVDFDDLGMMVSKFSCCGNVLGDD